MGFGENSDGLPSFEGIIGMTGFDLHGRVKFSIAFFGKKSSKYKAFVFQFMAGGSRIAEYGTHSPGNGL